MDKDAKQNVSFGLKISREMRKSYQKKWFFIIYKMFLVVSGWKVNGTRMLGSLQRKISGSNGGSKRVLLFFRKECSKRKFVFYFFKTMF